MKRLIVLLLSGLLAAASAATARAEEYDRYDRPASPPPRREAYAPPPRHGEYGQPYMTIHAGIFDPNDASDGLPGYDQGFNFDIGFGSRVTSLFAFEGTIGAYGADRGSDEVRVVPVTIGGRLIIPSPIFEPYFGFGGGFYSAHLKEAAVGSFSGVDDSDTTFGGYLGGGFDAWLGRRAALNFEAKYHMANPTFTSNAGNNFDVDVSGWVVNLGVRINFGGGAY